MCIRDSIYVGPVTFHTSGDVRVDAPAACIRQYREKGDVYKRQPLSSAQGWRGRQTSGSAERQKAPLAAGGEAARGASSDRQKNMANI